MVFLLDIFFICAYIKLPKYCSYQCFFKAMLLFSPRNPFILYLGRTCHTWCPLWIWQMSQSHCGGPQTSSSLLNQELFFLKPWRASESVRSDVLKIFQEMMIFLEVEDDEIRCFGILIIDHWSRESRTYTKKWRKTITTTSTKYHHDHDEDDEFDLGGLVDDADDDLDGDVLGIFTTYP